MRNNTMKGRLCAAAICLLFLAGCGGSSPTLDIAHELGRGVPSSAAYATTATDIHDAISGGSFRPYYATLARDLADVSVELDDGYIIDSVGGDGNFGFFVEYRQKVSENTFGEARRVHFPASGYKEISGGEYDGYGGYNVSANDDDHWVWSYAEFGEWADGTNYGTKPGEYVHVMGIQFPDLSRSFMVFGLETPVGRLPAGSATFLGKMRGDYFQPDEYETVSIVGGRAKVRGDVTLNMKFTNNTLDGEIRNISFLEPDKDDWEGVSATFDISEGRIVNGEFAAKLITKANGENTGGGGHMLGTFYGPNAEQAGAVMNITSEEGQEVMIGAITATRQ